MQHKLAQMKMFWRKYLLKTNTCQSIQRSFEEVVAQCIIINAFCIREALNEGTKSKRKA
jgi:hypothetical protein